MKTAIKRAFLTSIDKESVSHINMSVDKGECILLCGKSGCGKTTVTKLINGLIPHMASGKKEGSAYIKGVSVDGIPMYQLSKTVGSVFQNPKSQFFNLDTDSELTFAVENQGLSEDEINQRLEEVTESLKIGHLRNRSIFELLLSAYPDRKYWCWMNLRLISTYKPFIF